MPTDAAAPGAQVASAVTPERLIALAPGCMAERAEPIAAVIAAEGEVFGLDTPNRLAHFLAQVAHESAGFTRLEENLSYSAERLTRVWPTRFPTLAAAQPFARRPFALAERVYGGRLGNRAPGDGWTYRGRGLIQITGRENYATLGQRTGLPLVAKPGMAAQPAEATRIALSFWRWKGCGAPADNDDLEGVTRRINGHLTGLEDRAEWFARAKEILR